ncbi:fructose-6-phosphate aldolase [Candidatus Curtissbacteria bacterium RIFCSPHIGHO2_12_FULL_38_9b]|uniref:Fructose-6-phosphate aldolase n=1 Tax=Candidatus Curtissbacteria bacterium RIFCSPHIGHO2_12_FULL_38_9b TaxID=1797720 RepID=A0A1F5GTD8_9BACT|nr:MAG: fructose-6-phosphate aldolase [Candidatus Curtissbacteria bacterium RIFCSPHIGHO2_12_FULL_38_9b]
MKLFIDSANPEEVKKIAELGILDGVTTNPTLATLAGKDYKTAVDEILNTVNSDVSLEVLSTDTEGMLREARLLSRIHKNVVVKLPTTPDGLKALKILKEEGIRINMTLVFSANQALLVGKLGSYIVSPFAGRLDDIGHSAIDVIEEIRQIYDNYGFETQILFASVRSPLHVKQAALAGADIATCPYEVLEKLVHHPLTDIGLQKFLDDFKKSNQKPLV